MIFIEIGKIQAEIRMDDVREVLGKNSVEDVSWLCSLSVSELVSTLNFDCIFFDITICSRLFVGFYFETL